MIKLDKGFDEQFKMWPQIHILHYKRNEQF